MLILVNIIDFDIIHKLSILLLIISFKQSAEIPTFVNFHRIANSQSEFWLQGKLCGITNKLNL